MDIRNNGIAEDGHTGGTQQGTPTGFARSAAEPALRLWETDQGQGKHSKPGLAAKAHDA